MKVKDLNNLNIIKEYLSSALEDLDILTDEELFKITSSVIDYDDITTYDKELLINEVEAYIDEKKLKKELSIYLQYIHKQDYDLDVFLYFTPYNEDNLDINSLELRDLEYLTHTLETEISYYENELVKEELEAELISINKEIQEHQDLAYEFGITEDKQDTELHKKKDKVKKKRTKHSKEDIEAILAKEYITTKELSIVLPNMSLTKQASLRGRIHNRLPFYQEKRDCRITYKYSEVIEWKLNEDIRR